MTCLRVDSDITTKEMAGTISRLLNNTALGLDRILNKAILLVILAAAFIVMENHIFGIYVMENCIF